jgi:hypothetical protein
MADDSKPDKADVEEQEELEFEKLCDEKTKRYTRDCESGTRWRTAMAVTLFKRFNNDYHGYWDGQLSTWLDVPSQGLMKWPVIGPVVRANDSNWMSTKIKQEIEATSSDPQKKGAEVVAEAVFNYLYKKDWTSRAEQMMSQYCQLGFVYGLYSGFSKHASPKKIKVPKVRQEQVPADDPEWYCAECGVTGPATDLATEEGQDLSGAQKCPACGKMSAHVDEENGEDSKSIEVEDGYDEIAEGDSFTKIVPSLLFLIDEVNAKAADASGAQWFNYNRLSRRYELKALYGEAASGLGASDGKEWSDGVRWWHALESGASAPTDKSQASSGKGKVNDDDLLQERHWWFRPAVYGSWKSPADYSHPCGFKIKKGQTIQEAFEAQGKEYKGLYLCMVGKKVMYIDTEDHQDCWSFGLWMMNGASFYGKAQQELLDIQEAANEWFTMFFEYGERSSMPQTIADRQMFNRKDFDNRAGGVILTKKNFQRQKPISSYVMRLEPARLSSDLYSIFELLDKGKDDISGVSKASTGMGDSSNRTMGGQALLTQRSQGLMVPSQKSKGQAQGLWGKQQLKIAQRYWSDDRLRQVLSKLDKSWDDENIAAFRAIDIDTELIIEPAEGTDIPTTFHEKGEKLMAVVASGILWNPEVPVDLREQIAHMLNIDYDPEGVEAQRRRQQEVYGKIQAACAFVEKQGTGYVQLPDSDMPQVNPQAVEQVQTMPGIKILPRSENIEFAMDFFNKYLVALGSAEHPDELLMAVLQDRVDKLQVIKAQNMQAAAVAAGTISGQAGAAEAGGQGAEQGGVEAPKMLVNYKDAPEDIRRQMEAKDDLTPSSDAPAAPPDQIEHARTLELNAQKHAHDKEKLQMAHEHAKELEAMKAAHATDQAQNSKIPQSPA